MSLNVGKELAVLERMTVKELKTRYAEMFGEETRAHNKSWLLKRIAWRLQVLAEGDLSERARQRAAELACDADLRLSPPRVVPPKQAEAGPTRSGQPGIAAEDSVLVPGSIISRDYKGQNYQVLVRRNGFEFDGEIYRSLSAIELKPVWPHQHLVVLPLVIAGDDGARDQHAVVRRDTWLPAPRRPRFDLFGRSHLRRREPQIGVARQFRCPLAGSLRQIALD